MSRFKGLAGLAVACVVSVPVLMSVPRDGWAQIEEIVVTTRKREESLQDVPIAVSAIGGEQIERQGLTDLFKISELDSSVQFDNAFGPSDARVTVRGLSNTRGRSNVAFLVDGVDVTTENLVTAGSGLLANRRLLNDVERIEVVKGPQSALYGRAAFAGAIGYTTKDPGDVLEGKIGVDVADYGLYSFDAALGGPVTGMEDVLGMRVTGTYWTDEGFYTNSVSGENVGGGEGWGIAWKTKFTPTDEFEIETRFEYSDEEYDPQPRVRVGGGLPDELQPQPGGTQDNSLPPDADGDGFPDLDPNDFTCSVGGNFKPFPQEAIDTKTLLESLYDPADLPPGTSLSLRPVGFGGAFGGAATGLLDFGPGLCVPDSYGNAAGRVVTHSEDPLTGEDYPGTEQETFRGSILMTLDANWGTFQSTTGFTDFDALDTFDQDFQALGRPDRLLGMQQARATLQTSQLSEELRFTSNWNGPAQMTLGFLYWDETRKLLDQNVIISCLDVVKNNDGVPTSGISGLCDGTGGTVANWQEFFQQLPIVGEPNIRGSQWRAETEHLSWYASLDIELADNWSLTLENRWVDEDFYLRKPSFSSCTSLGFQVAGGPLAGLPRESIGDPANLQPGEDIVCNSEEALNNTPSSGGVDLYPRDSQNTWSLIEGTESSHYTTPKVTLRWTPTDSSTAYFSWARGQKPGGINQLTAGGTPVSIDDERFLPEKLEAWELGLKTDFEAAGFWRLNTAVFFQDYTDKQIGTQILAELPGGGQQLQPRIVNAAAAEVWGFEIATQWQPYFLEGLTIDLGYTYLDAEFVEFTQTSASSQRTVANGECPVVIAEEFDNGGTPGDTTDDSLTARAQCQYDLSGNKLERTPEHAFTGSVKYIGQFGDTGFDWFGEFNAQWQDKRFQGEDNFTSFDSYWLADLRLGLQGDNWDALIYVENLFDDDTIKTGGSGPDFGQQVTQTGFTAGLGASHWFGVLPDKRRFGVRIAYRY